MVRTVNGNKKIGKKSQGNKYRTLKGTRERGFHSS